MKVFLKSARILGEILYLPFYGIQILMIGMIRLYQIFLSPLLPPLCRFHPSCSEYFLQALQKKGIIKGCILGTWRILRCNPFSPGGYDPVDPGEKNSSVGIDKHSIPKPRKD